MIRWLTRKLLAREYVRSAIRDRADLSAFRERPTPRIVAGLVVIGLSYCIGWPVIGLLGILAVWWETPLLVAVGGPVMYGLSHLVFILGFYLAGAKYTHVFMRWATRTGVEKLRDVCRARERCEGMEFDPPEDPAESR